MFGIPQKELLRNLELIRKNHCSYSGTPCDCKYLGLVPGKELNYFSEHNGCPELRMALAILESMSQLEFMEFCNKAGIRIIT